MGAPAQRIPEKVLEDARSRHLLSAIVGRYVALRRSGTSWKALCPFHQERTPSFTVNDRRGFYHCFGCGAHGDAIGVLMQLGGMSFHAAVADLLNAPLESHPARFEREFRGRAAEFAGRHDDDLAAIEKARGLLGACASTAGTLAESYLRARGLRGPIPDCLRFGARVPYWHTWKRDERPLLLGEFPALVAAAENDAGVTAVQVTYLGADGTKLKLPDRDEPGAFLPAKKSKGVIGTAAVRLSHVHGATLGLGEGIETSWSARTIYSVPVWAILGHNRFAARLFAGEPRAGARVVKIPAGVANIIIFADRDKSGGIDAVALDAAEALEHQGYGVEVIGPERGFKDFNDQLRAELK